MERYHIYKLGIAILFYAIYCRRPTLVNGLEVDDAFGNVNDTSHRISAREYFVYYQGVQGRPGVDFPNYARIPRTAFSCKDVESGYYADLETDCQVFHICNEGTKVSFLCPNGTIFQQSDLICDWWFKVNCTNSPSLYEESAEQLRESLVRKKASRRVFINTGSYENSRPAPSSASLTHQTPAPSSRKIDVDNRQGRQRHVFASNDPASSEEMQITQESASFVADYNRNAYHSTPNSYNNANPYPNHRQTYSDIQDPKTYYTNKPAASMNTLNNGRPFVVSTPKLGSYTTEKPAFKYSPTVPTVKKLNYITPLPAMTSTKKYMSTYGERIRLANQFASNAGSNGLPKAYSNVETFTSPPSVANGKSTTPRKPKHQQKNSFTIGLNSVQGQVSFKLPTTSTTNAPVSRGKDFTKTKSGKNVIKLNLSSDGPAKSVNTKTPKAKVRLDFGDLEVPKLKLSLENEIPSATNRPQNGFYVTKSTFRPGEHATSRFNAGSITGSKNTYIPTTGRPLTTTTYNYEPNESTTFSYISNTFGFVKPTGVPKPKPFELPSSTTSRTRTTTEVYGDTTAPNYQISSASPFTNVPPTLPSIYSGYGYVGSTPGRRPEDLNSRVLPENVGNMLQTLQQIANVRFAKKENLESDAKRPGLVVPPSVGPQTLHTLAVYFANALDSLVEERGNGTQQPVETSTQESTTQEPNDSQDNTLINSLLSQDTVNKYKELFMIMAQKEMQEAAAAEEADDDMEDEQEDLQREHSNNAVQSPRVRQLAKVFTQALSSYLDDPETFKKVLQEIRPTEPPPLNTLPTESPNNNEEDELLNFSDADIKPENPRLPTPAPPNPTWGYILAYNTSTPSTTTSDYKSNHIDQNDENLQSADSQSFVPGFNDITSNRVDKSLRHGLPNNHWTSSPDVTKLWQSTLYVNPLHINQNFDTTEPLLATSTEENSEESFEESSQQQPGDDVHQPVDLTEYNTESYVDYELRSLPNLNLNTTSVHGLLIDFMNSSINDENGRLQRILRKLNTTQDEFLNKMKEIEKNPLTKRLILLLVSECGNKTDAKSHAVRDIINLARSNSRERENGDYHRPQREQQDERVLNGASSNNVRDASHRTVTGSKERSRGRENSVLGKLVDPSLKDDDQDSRALQLLNSLYSIASQYGKK